MNKEILFITGNEDKFREFGEILVSVRLKRKNLDLPELQGIPEEIVKEKARLACRMTGKRLPSHRSAIASRTRSLSAFRG